MSTVDEKKVITIEQIDMYIQDIMSIIDYCAIDVALNGIQVSEHDRHIGLIATAVDASMESFSLAVEHGADMLLVHHGIYWAKCASLIGDHYKRVQFLMNNNLALYALHLPLDAHMEYGNNIALARLLDMQDIQPWASYKNIKIGVYGMLKKPLAIEHIIRTLFEHESNILGYLPFGSSTCQKIAIVCGSGEYFLEQAIQLDIDTFITGDTSHIVYHQALEAGINVIFGGHYATETGGVRLLGSHLAEHFGIDVIHMNIPTGL